jgi:hypothetical protein
MKLVLLFAFMFLFFFGCSTNIDCYEDKNINLGKDIKVCLKS